MSATLIVRSATLTTAPLSRDPVLELITFLDTTGGRDKLARFLQYFSKFMKWHYEIHPEKSQATQWIARWGSLSTSMSTTRKVLRFLRTISVLRSLRQSLPSQSGQPWTLTLVWGLLAKLSLAWYFASDHLMYAQRIGWWNPSPETLKLADQSTEGAWLGEIIFTILEILGKMHHLTGTDSKSNAAREALLRGLLRNLIDLPVALHFLGLTGTHPHGHFGALGALSSLMGIYESWPTVFRPANTL